MLGHGAFWKRKEKKIEKKINTDLAIIASQSSERQFMTLKVFGKQKSERMPVCKTWDHAIDLQEEFVPRKGRIYPLSRIEREEVQAFVDSQLKKSYIQPSKSPQTLPVMFVPKKDGKRRMVQDYQYVNKFTVKNSYSLPLISDLVDNMGTKRIFTKMDLRWGYNNIRIKEDDKWKAAFTMHIGSFKLVVMFFGLTNLLATFQTMMNDIFRDLINKGDVATFIDDMLVGTETEEGHDELVEEILRRLEEHDLYVKPEKCEWKVREVGFLGVVIGPDVKNMEKEKVRGVLEWPTPKCVKDVQKFLGLANYYRRLVKDFAEIARPMHRLVRKQEKWNWGAEQEEVFRRLKEIFTSELVLAAPDLDKEMRVEADASDYAMGGVLSIKCQDKRWRPVAYISKLLSDTEKNYKIHDKEMLVVIRLLATNHERQRCQGRRDLGGWRERSATRRLG